MALFMSGMHLYFSSNSVALKEFQTRKILRSFESLWRGSKIVKDSHSENSDRFSLLMVMVGNVLQAGRSCGLWWSAGH